MLNSDVYKMLCSIESLITWTRVVILLGFSCYKFCVSLLKLMTKKICTHKNISVKLVELMPDRVHVLSHVPHSELQYRSQEPLLVLAQKAKVKPRPIIMDVAR